MTKYDAARVSSLLLLTTLIGLLPTACNPREVTYPESGATLEGKITFGNEVVPFALVIAAGQTSATGTVNRDGTYSIKNCPLGEVKIAVNTEAGRGEYMSLIMSSSQPQPDGKVAKTVNIKFVEVPKQYHEPDTTPLRTTVNKGNNTFNIVIPKS